MKRTEKKIGSVSIIDNKWYFFKKTINIIQVNINYNNFFEDYQKNKTPFGVFMWRRGRDSNSRKPTRASHDLQSCSLSQTRTPLHAYHIADIIF